MRIPRKDQARRSRTAGEFRILSHQILQYASRGVIRSDFQKEVTRMILDFSGCEEAELWVADHGKYFRCRAKRSIDPSVLFTISALVPGEMEGEPSSEDDGTDLLSLCRAIIEGRVDPSQPGFTPNGSYWTGDASRKAMTPVVPFDWVENCRQCRAVTSHRIRLEPLEDTGRSTDRGRVRR